MAWLRWLVSLSDLKTGWLTVSGRPAKSEWKPRMLFQTSARVPPLTMLVAVIAPGFTRGLISGPPSTFCANSTATMELKRIPVASTPIRFSMASSPDSSMTLAMVKTLEIDWMETSDLTSPAV